MIKQYSEWASDSWQYHPKIDNTLLPWWKKGEMISHFDSDEIERVSLVSV
jgi:hypothetical protein